MIREPLVEKGVGTRDGFRWRSREISRVEGFTDAVFAFAVTLLVVSLEVPHTFHDLWEMMSGFFAFAFAFALLVWFWYQQYLYFRRYGLDGAWSIALNAALLFVVLFFVYPLKFLFTILIKMFSGQDARVHLPDGTLHAPISPPEWGPLMTIYGLGYLAVFAIFLLMYLHAWRHRDRLGLDAVERFDTRTSMLEFLLNIGVALVSLAIIQIGGPAWAAVSGLTYAAVGPLMGTLGSIRGIRRDRLRRAS